MPSSFTALYVAYTIVWAGVFAYLAYLHVRQSRVSSELKILREEVLKHGK